MNLEIFSCAGGMAEGFRRAGILFDMVVDFSEDACESYERNIGHKPIRMDARDLLRMVRAGWRPPAPGLDLLVADPPCTPWSRAGKREGLEDERDMLADTCELIRLLEPRWWVIGNVPGLDDSTNAGAIKKTIGKLSRWWCVDYRRLDAADYGTVAPCPFHAFAFPVSTAAFADPLSPAETEVASAAASVTTRSEEGALRDALTAAAHLARATRAAFVDGATADERLNSLLRLARMEMPIQTGAVEDMWTSEGTSACGWTTDTSVIIGEWLRASWDALYSLGRLSTTSTKTPQTMIRRILRSIAATAITWPRTGGARFTAGCGLCLDDGVPQHRIRPFWIGHPRSERCIAWPAPTHCDPDRCGNLLPGHDALLPWVTVRQALEGLSPDEMGRPVRLRKRAQNGVQHGSVLDRPALVVGTSNLSDGNVLLSGEPQPRKGRHYVNPFPPSTLDAPASTLTTRGRAGCRGEGILLLDLEGQGRTASIDEPAPAVTAPSPAISASRANRGAQGGRAVEVEEDWPWNRPATTVTADPNGRIAPPGHQPRSEPEGSSVLSMPGAVVLSEKAAALLQGFPPDWHFAGKTKSSRWAQIGMAVPPALAHVVAAAIAKRMRGDRIDG